MSVFLRSSLMALGLFMFSPSMASACDGKNCDCGEKCACGAECAGHKTDGKCDCGEKCNCEGKQGGDHKCGCGHAAPEGDKTTK